jgi:hypothetical protein
MKKLSALIALALFAAPVAYAQDGLSCATSIVIPGGTQTYSTNTTTNGATIYNNYGPLASPSNDAMYTFTTGATAPGAGGTIRLDSADFSAATYLLDSCPAGLGGPTPIGVNATVGGQITLPALLANHQYYVAITGTAAGGAGAQGTVGWTISPPYPVELQSFEID